MTAAGNACGGCLRRSELLAQLAPEVAAAFSEPKQRVEGVLRLDDQQLVEAVGGRAPVKPAEPGFEESARRALEAEGIDALCRHSERYPGSLKALEDPPAALFMVGAEPLEAFIGDPVVTIVGARRASPYALEVAHELARGLAAAGITVVSGLALGVDAAAHRGALDGGGRTIAVLASGPDVPYPRTNRALYRRVRERGLVVSEMPPGHPAFRWGFPARNRIMAGLAALTIVVEAAEQSGSLITAAFAEQLGRDVGAVPGRVTARVAAGTNQLLRDGAVVIRDASDALDELFGVGLGPREGDDPADARKGASSGGGALAGAELEPPLLRVLDAVESGRSLDSVGRAARIPAGEVRAALARLELLGLVSRDPFGLYERRAER